MQLEKEVKNVVQEDLEHVLIISEHEKESLQLLWASFRSKLRLQFPLQFLLSDLCLFLLLFLHFFCGSIFRLLLLFLLTFDEVLDLKLFFVNLELVKILQDLPVEIEMQMLDQLLVIPNGYLVQSQPLAVTFDGFLKCV